MKKLKYVKLFCVMMTVAAAVSANGETLLGSWDFNGTPTTKTVDSIMATDGYPSGGFVSESRTVLEDSDGDVVYGWPREGTLSSSTLPALSADGGGASSQPGDTSMLFKGAERNSAHIGEAMRSISTAFKVEFDFKLYEPQNWADGATATTLLSGGLNRFDLRLVTSTGPQGKIVMYCYKAGGGATAVETDISVDMSGWNHLEFWLQNGIMNIKINGGTTFSNPLGAALAGVTEDQYDGLTLGARFDGAGRWARIYMDNLALYELVDGCGSWGYLPTDFNEDCIVDIQDLKTLAGAWLDCTDPQGSGCVNVLN
jgi:hypothetical protein